MHVKVATHYHHHFGCIEMLILPYCIVHETQHVLICMLSEYFRYLAVLSTVPRLFVAFIACKCTTWCYPTSQIEPQSNWELDSNAYQFLQMSPYWETLISVLQTHRRKTCLQPPGCVRRFGLLAEEARRFRPHIQQVLARQPLSLRNVANLERNTDRH